MLASLVSFFGGLKIKHLLLILGLLALLGTVGLSYKAGRSDGYRLAQVENLESADRNKDQVIEELRLISDRQIELQEENRRSNRNLSNQINNKFSLIDQSIKDSINVPTVVNSDCRAEYDGTIGVFKSLASAGSDGTGD